MSPGSLERTPRLVLASASPRRRRLLSELGLTLEVRPVEIDESPRAGESPGDLVTRLAWAKATAEAAPDELVLAADTLVVLDDCILGKPADPDDASAMLMLLAGREHKVFTGVVLFEAGSGRSTASLEISRVRLAPLTVEEVSWYVATGEPMDKAGAYAIQGLGALFVEEIDGNYTNVVGLPLPTVYRLFRDLGYDLLSFRDPTPPERRAGSGNSTKSGRRRFI